MILHFVIFLKSNAYDPFGDTLAFVILLYLLYFDLKGIVAVRSKEWQPLGNMVISQKSSAK